jgi:hypothetical protein
VATVYGAAQFNCVAAAQDCLIAGDSSGNVWILDIAPAPQRRPASLLHNERLDRLNQLPAQRFNELLYRLDVPENYLSGASAPQTARAIELCRYLESQNRLAALDQAIATLC